jgi:hypothetical protein
MVSLSEYCRFSGVFTVPGFRINPNNVARMASDVRDLVKDIDPKNTVVVIQVLDNSTLWKRLR